MRKFIEFEIHEYMDMYPYSSFMAMEEFEAQGFADRMNKYYSGGTTRFVRALTKEEAVQYTLNQIKDIVQNPTTTTKDGSLASMDVDLIKNIISELDKCYK